MSVAEQDTTFEAYSYRVSARFGSRVRVAVGNDTVALLALLGTLIFWDWRGLPVALLLLLAHLAASGFGAGCLWELANLTAFIEGTSGESIAFPLNTVKRVKVGKGWARRGMWLLILPYVAGINSLGEGFCVSFEAPDGETGREVVHALHMHSPDEARALSELIRGKATHG